MMNMHSKYDNMHRNGMFYAFIDINNHVIVSISCRLWAGAICAVVHIGTSMWLACKVPHVIV